MHLNEVQISHLKSIDEFTLRFQEPAGWHVIIGDNGAGKSSILRAIALALIGPSDIQALRLELKTWIQKGQEGAIVACTCLKHDMDGYSGNSRPIKRPLKFGYTIEPNAQANGGSVVLKEVKSNLNPNRYIWSGTSGWFSCGFGPFRRFTGGEKDWSKVFYSNPKAASHLSVFGEDVALTEAMEWLGQLKFQSFEKNQEASYILESLKTFVNSGMLLPHGVKLHEVTSSGVSFADGNGYELSVTELSDGFRSILSMIFELIRQMVQTYGAHHVFNRVNEGIIDVPGVVLIDEVDAHLHPTWQTRIGDWFTKTFPQIQFIVTTHSPLVCRAAQKGSIWRLAAPGSKEESGEVLGTQRDRLLYGNILDAFGTEVFGQTPVQHQAHDERKQRLGQLNMRAALGTVTEDEERERKDLQKILATDDPLAF